MNSKQTDATAGVARDVGFWDKFWKDRSGHGQVVVGQRPNVWLAIWLVCFVVALFLDVGTAHNIVSFVGSAFLVVWAVLELTRGVDYFRRVLGAVVLFATVVFHFI